MRNFLIQSNQRGLNSMTNPVNRPKPLQPLFRVLNNLRAVANYRRRQAAELGTWGAQDKTGDTGPRKCRGRLALRRVIGS